jgi:hypothetical protein
MSAVACFCGCLGTAFCPPQASCHRLSLSRHSSRPAAYAMHWSAMTLPGRPWPLPTVALTWSWSGLCMLSSSKLVSKLMLLPPSASRRPCCRLIQPPPLPHRWGCPPSCPALSPDPPSKFVPADKPSHWPGPPKRAVAVAIARPSDCLQPARRLPDCLSVSSLRAKTWEEL